MAYSYPTNLYQGWDPASAQADFNHTGGAGKAGAAPSTSSSSSNSSSSQSTPSAYTFDPVAEAQKLQQFNVQANQPAIASLQASKAPLEQRYSDLVANIKGNQTTATNAQTVTTNNELARRGIQGGGYADQQLQNALQPIGVQYSGLLGQANTGQSTDESAINNAIAQLQSGDPNAAVSGALQYGGIESQANQAAASLAQQQVAQNQNFQLSQQNYGLQQQQLAQQLAQQKIANQFTQQGLGIQGGQLANSQANTAIAGSQFNYNTGVTPWQ